MEVMQDVTLCFLLRENEVCLAMKKRGFGKGKWNGVGGKVERGESLEDSMIREIKEEIDVTVDTQALEKVANIEFIFRNKVEWDQRMHVFFVHTWTGEPKETEEMAPQWFTREGIPFDDMWVDDIYWVPRVLSGEKLEGTCILSSDGETMEHFDLRTI